MPRVLGLPAALAARGLPVEVVPGWQTRGSAAFNPGGALSHWTAGPRTGDRPSLRVVVEGRADLAGPLAHVFLTRAGVAVVVAAGRANHAGRGGWRGLTGNSAVFGTEAESSGTGDWTAAQRRAYPLVNAAYCDLGGFGPDMLAGHHEWAPGRKVDIRDWPMPAMREQVAALLRTPTPPAPPVPTIDPWEGYDMRALVEAAYRTELGRRASEAEADSQAVSAALRGLTPRQVVAGIQASTEAKRWAVTKIYADLLGRRATATEADGWLRSAGGDLTKIRTGVAASAEAKLFARRPAADRAQRTSAALTIR